MSFRILTNSETKWKPCKGLDGPFFFLNGLVLYFNKREKQYYNPVTDFYVEDDVVEELQQQMFNTISATA